jgi:hypothetical protein
VTSLPTLYTLNELNEQYGWSIDTLYDYIRSGDLPASKIGRTYVVTAEGVAIFLAKRAARTDES